MKGLIGLIAISLTIFSVSCFAQHVALLCPHEVIKTVNIGGENYNVPEEDNKVYEGELIKYQGNMTELKTDKGIVVYYNCTTIDVKEG